MSDNNISKGKELLQNGNLKEALKIFDAILEENPFHSEALHQKVMVSINFDPKKDEKLPSAYKAIRLEIDIDKSMELNDIGADLAMMGRYQEALSYYDDSLKANPRNHLAISNKGLAYANLGKPEKGLQLIEKSLSIEPKFVEGLTNIIVPLQMLGRLDDALKYLEKALNIDPKFVYAWYYKGIMFINEKKYEEAFECFEEAIKLDPNNNDILKFRDIALKSLKSVKKGDNK